MTTRMERAEHVYHVLKAAATFIESEDYLLIVKHMPRHGTDAEIEELWEAVKDAKMADAIQTVHMCEEMFSELNEQMGQLTDDDEDRKTYIRNQLRRVDDEHKAALLIRADGLLLFENYIQSLKAQGLGTTSETEVTENVRAET